MTDTARSSKPPAAAIYALTIERFRGITSLKWKPSRFSSAPSIRQRSPIPTITTEIAQPGSPLGLFLSLPFGAEMSRQMKPSWPWEWTGEDVAVPILEHDGKLVGEPVCRVRVRGTEDLELADETRPARQLFRRAATRDRPRPPER